MKPAPPPSASSFLINLAGGLCFVCALLLLRAFRPDAALIEICVIGLAAGTVPILLGEIFLLRVHKRARAAWTVPAPPDTRRIRIKLAGFYGSLAMAALIYGLFPEYHRDFYQPFFMLFCTLMALPALIGGWMYIAYADCRMPEPEDRLYHFGLIMCGRWRDADKHAAWGHVKSVILRVFFVPIMFIYLLHNLIEFMEKDPLAAARSLASIPPDAVLPDMHLLSALLLGYMIFAAIDIMFAMIGYLVTFRALDSDIRSVEPTMTGWIVCLVCYYPFWEILAVTLMFGDFYANPAWYVWFADNPALLVGWGALVIVAMMVESFTTMTFGIRFSNLTYRGLITSGPFRFTKHPQYLAKLVNRFLFFVPFLNPDGPAAAAWVFLLYGLICAIYYLRARTEENHLSRYPEYVEYARWIDDHGIFRFICRIHPGFKYDPARAQAGKLLPRLA